MHIPGKRIRRTRIVRTAQYVVAIEVDAIIPDADPTDACYEPETVDLLREVEARANSGDLVWLQQRGKVYAAINAA